MDWLVLFWLLVEFDCPCDRCLAFTRQPLGGDHAAAAAPAVLTALTVAPAAVHAARVGRAGPERRPASSGASDGEGGGWWPAVGADVRVFAVTAGLTREPWGVGMIDSCYR